MSAANDRPEIRVRWPHGGWLIWNWELIRWEHTLTERQEDIDAAYTAGKQAYFYNIGTHGPTDRALSVEERENQLWQPALVVLASRVSSRHKASDRKGDYMTTMIDITSLSNSYPYLSLSRELGMNYDDVLMASDLFQPRGSITMPEMSRVTALVKRLEPEQRRAIAQVAAAIATGELGHAVEG